VKLNNQATKETPEKRFLTAGGHGNKPEAEGRAPQCRSFCGFTHFVNRIKKKTG
jgi:hypothetical protein